jgi:RNA polymerase sigma-70 factor (ECF subfamily)
MPYKNLKDSELTDLIRTGDEVAFAEIYQRHWTVMYAHALKMLNNEEDARDAIQDLFATLWTKSKDIQSTINISGYLFVTLKNKIIDLIHHRRSEAKYLDSLAAFAVDHTNETLAALTEKELMEALDLEIQQLPPKMKVIFEMRVKQHKSYKEIAEALDISDKTVKKQVSNAIKIIKPKLNSFSSWPIILLLVK